MESVKRMDGAKRIENLVDRLAESHILSREEFCFLLDNIEPEQDGYLLSLIHISEPTRRS